MILISTSFCLLLATFQTVALTLHKAIWKQKFGNRKAWKELQKAHRKDTGHSRKFAQMGRTSERTEQKCAVHALLICQDHRVCELRKHFSFLFTPFFEDFSATQPFLLQQVNNQLVHDFLSQQNNRLFLFLSELMDLFVAGRDQSAADQPNNLAEGHPQL